MQTEHNQIATALASSSTTPLPPPVGTVWPGQGGIYSGVINGRLPGTSYHLITGPKLFGTWGNAKAQAAALNIDGHQDFTLPFRDELELQRRMPNFREIFTLDWHWSCEQDAANPVCAWIQLFTDGDQYDLHKSNEYHVRPVRRILIIE